MEGLISVEDTNKGSLVCTQKPVLNDIISVAECKEYLGNCELTDNKVNDIKNNLIGIIDSVINSYLDGFRQ
jgi:hypothetical protein